MNDVKNESPSSAPKLVVDDWKVDVRVRPAFSNAGVLLLLNARSCVVSDSFAVAGRMLANELLAVDHYLKPAALGVSRVMLVKVKMILLIDHINNESRYEC